ncbi:MAG: TIGR04086 family membrane protein [Ruminococcaceae bacterium]|nr:TIGR04086 family membrane protein [Oscillospiraceae bacterium]
MIKTVNASPLIPALKGAAISLLVSLFALFVSTFFLTESKSLELMTALLPKVFQVISAIIGGFFAGKFSKDKSFLSGIFSGLIFSAIITVGTLINSGFRLYYVLISTLIITLGSFIGSLLSREKSKSGAAKRKSIMKKMRS